MSRTVLPGGLPVLGHVFTPGGKPPSSPPSSTAWPASGGAPPAPEGEPPVPPLRAGVQAQATTTRPVATTFFMGSSSDLERHRFQPHLLPDLDDGSGQRRHGGGHLDVGELHPVLHQRPRRSELLDDAAAELPAQAVELAQL